MRSIWAVLVGSIGLAVLMQLTNYGFEAAGSVPDLEGCGFLAGGLGTLATVYPLLAALTAARIVCRMGSMNSDERLHIVGAAAGLIGSTLYFSIGFILALGRGHYEALSLPVACWSLCFVLLCCAGGCMGAIRARNGMRFLYWRDSGS